VTPTATESGSGDPTTTSACSMRHPPGLCVASRPRSTWPSPCTRTDRKTVPDARLIAILRDPVDRAYSNWAHLWADGLEPIDNFVAACAEEEKRIQAGWAPFWRYLGTGLYGRQLEHLYSLSPVIRFSSSVTSGWWRNPRARSMPSAAFSVSTRVSSTMLRPRTSVPTSTPHVPRGSSRAPCAVAPPWAACSPRRCGVRPASRCCG